MSDMELVDCMDQVWRSLATLCSGFTEAQWKTPTDCPGWSVQDQLSHLVGAESGILGQATPEHVPSKTDHVKNDIGRRNEVVLDWRRTRPGSQVLQEFQELTSQRMGKLRAMSEGDFASETMTPIGPGTEAEFLRLRIFDAWIHEQDIRRAVGEPGHLEGPVAEHSMGRLAMAMPYVVGKKAQAGDGVTVVFDVTGDAGRRIPVGMDGSRARVLDETPAQPTVRLNLDIVTFACLGCGRLEPAQALATGKVTITGDRDLGETIVNQMNIMI